jgi:hypothetical protein
MTGPARTLPARPALPVNNRLPGSEKPVTTLSSARLKETSKRPGFDQLDGRGLWLANQLCDLVQIRWDGENVVGLRLSSA